MPEMVVATGILSLFIALAFATIMPGLKITREAEQSLSAQKEVLLALEDLHRELSLTERLGVSVAPECLSFLSTERVDPVNPAIPDSELDIIPGRVSADTFLKHVVLRLRDRRIKRREFPYAKGQEICPILPVSLLTVADNPAFAEKTFCEDVEYFEAVPVGGTRVAVTIRSVHRDADKPQACQMTMQISMRGGT